MTDTQIVIIFLTVGYGLINIILLALEPLAKRQCRGGFVSRGRI